GTAANPGIYVEGLAASSEAPKDFFIRMEKENLEDLDLFLETVVTVGSFGHRITLAVPDRSMANEINGRLAQFFYKMDPAHMTELTERIRAAHTPGGNALTAFSEAGGRMDAIVPLLEAKILLHQENLRKQLDRVIVSDQFKAGAQEIKVEKQGLLLKARLLLEAALTSKSTNALLQAGADLSLFFPNPDIASENLSAFLTGLNAAAQKVLTAA
ncbi:MAG TPA: hypothetical protein VJC08_03875, partial [bacterium]|nr:hypothetical protein [bacterium]